MNTPGTALRAPEGTSCEAKCNHRRPEMLSKSDTGSSAEEEAGTTAEPILPVC